MNFGCILEAKFDAIWHVIRTVKFEQKNCGLGKCTLSDRFAEVCFLDLGTLTTRSID